MDHKRVRGPNYPRGQSPANAHAVCVSGRLCPRLGPESLCVCRPRRTSDIIQRLLSIADPRAARATAAAAAAEASPASRPVTRPVMTVRRGAAGKRARVSHLRAAGVASPHFVRVRHTSPLTLTRSSFVGVAACCLCSFCCFCGYSAAADDGSADDGDDSMRANEARVARAAQNKMPTRC